jgi:hypothetical protein
MYLTMPVGIDPAFSVMLWQEIVNTYYVRLYFRYTGATTNQLFPIQLFAAGAGDGGLDFYAYGANQGTITRFTIDSAYISNVCFASP